MLKVMPVYMLRARGERGGAGYDGYAGEYFEVLATEGHDGMVPSS